METKNLTILFTDIVGYTTTTARQSRKENEDLLDRHNRILLPIVDHFDGELIKTIGDALLLVFSSPTDAMLCSMAMQDALFDHNRNVEPDRQIHIRIAASLGEVRVAENDIFGDPVNLTSRIESITPADEIYFSDAVYMTMNKAEVPCIEVGMRSLKGISAPVRIWQIPRFSKPRLVPEEIMEGKDICDIAYPFGGAHLLKSRNTHSRKGANGGRYLLVTLLVFLVLLAAAAGYFLFQRDAGSPAGQIQEKSFFTGEQTHKADVESSDKEQEPPPEGEASVTQSQKDIPDADKGTDENNNPLIGEQSEKKQPESKIREESLDVPVFPGK